MDRIPAPDEPEHELVKRIFEAIGQMRTEYGKEAAVVESVKAASDIYAPVAGVVVAANDEIAAAPEKVNADPYGSWLFKLKPSDPAAPEKLLDAPAYAKVAGDD